MVAAWADELQQEVAARGVTVVDRYDIRAVHVTLLGGGFGRKSKPDFASEAAICSHAMGGRPVKLTFTREDDRERLRVGRLLRRRPGVDRRHGGFAPGA